MIHLHLPNAQNKEKSFEQFFVPDASQCNVSSIRYFFQILGHNINLGMVPAYGHLPASKLKEKYVQRIEAFGLSFKQDVINSTNDGCAVMKLVGKKIKPKLMQLCLAHGFQLGICKTVYKKKKKPKEDSSEVLGK